MNVSPVGSSRRASAGLQLQSPEARDLRSSETGLSITAAAPAVAYHRQVAPSDRQPPLAATASMRACCDGWQLNRGPAAALGTADIPIFMWRKHVSRVQSLNLTYCAYLQLAEAIITVMPPADPGGSCG